MEGFCASEANLIEQGNIMARQFTDRMKTSVKKAGKAKSPPHSLNKYRPD